VIPSGEPPPTAGDRASSDHNTIFRVSFDLSGSLEKTSDVNDFGRQAGHATDIWLSLTRIDSGLTGLCGFPRT
jgi:hypothetical protein